MDGVDAGGGRRAFAKLLTKVVWLRLSVALMLLTAVAAAIGMVLPRSEGVNWVYGSLWFQVLLALLAITAAGALVRGKGKDALWRLLIHGGIAVILAGALVTRLTRVEGGIVLHEGESAARLEFGDAGGLGALPFGFSIKLVDFRIQYYPPLEYLLVAKHNAWPSRVRVEASVPAKIPATEWTLNGIIVGSKVERAVVETVFPDGKQASVAAEAGQEHPLPQGYSLRILRYEPAFKINIETGSISSAGDIPENPAVEVQLVREGEVQPPVWLFAKVPGFKRTKQASGGGAQGPELLYLHPAVAYLRGNLEKPSGSFPLCIAEGAYADGPTGTGIRLGYQRDQTRVRELESEVEILKDGVVVKRHVIRVNRPLAYDGFRFNQSGYDENRQLWTYLGVSRDHGVWVVFAGFAVLTLGLLGNFYLRPALTRARADAVSGGRRDG